MWRTTKCLLLPAVRMQARQHSDRASGAAAAIRAPGNAEVMRRLQALEEAGGAETDDDDFEAELQSAVQRSSAIKQSKQQSSQDSTAPTAGSAPPSRAQIAANTRIRTAKFIGSAVKLDQCPAPTMPEFAVVGRSNVGKSSLINMLTRNAKLAATSKQPGAPAPAPANARPRQGHERNCMCCLLRAAGQSTAMGRCWQQVPWHANHHV